MQQCPRTQGLPRAVRFEAKGPRERAVSTLQGGSPSQDVAHERCIPKPCLVSYMPLALEIISQAKFFDFFARSGKVTKQWLEVRLFHRIAEARRAARVRLMPGPSHWGEKTAPARIPRRGER